MSKRSSLRDDVFVATIGVLLTGIPIIIYELIANTILDSYQMLTFDAKYTFITTGLYYIFAFIAALYALSRQWTQLSEYLTLGTCAFLPIWAILFTLPVPLLAPLFGSQGLNTTTIYIVIMKTMPEIYLSTASYWWLVFRSPVLRWLGIDRPRYLEPPSTTRAPSVLIQHADINQNIAAGLRYQSIAQSFLSIIISLNISVFVALVLLTAGTSIDKAFAFCLVILIASTISLGIRAALAGLTLSGTVLELGLASISILMSASWGLLTVFVFTKEEHLLLLFLLAFLACGGFVMVTLSSHRFHAVVAGAAALFCPFIYVVVDQRPAAWGSYMAASGLCIIIIVGFGFALYKRHEEQTRLRIELSLANLEISAKTDRLQQALAAAEEANARIRQEHYYRERVLRAIGHDLRQPINALGLFLHQIPEADLSCHAADTINMCRMCARAANNTIESISQFAWLSGKVTVCSTRAIPLAPLFSRLCIEFQADATAKGIQLRSVPCSVQIVGDERLIERILRNYLSNAIRCTKTGGVLLGARRRKTTLEVLCVDTGPGIRYDDQQRIFDEFYQGTHHSDTLRGGLGIGLTIAKELAALMGAKTSLRSVVGKGSSFGILLPVAPQPHA